MHEMVSCAVAQPLNVRCSGPRHGQVERRRFAQDEQQQ